jgi:transcriptional regulator with XRE-family HTH domain
MFVTSIVPETPYQSETMISSAQLRAARAMLRWTVRDLADRSGVHRNTVCRAEASGAQHGHAVAQLVLTLEAAGVEFVPGGVLYVGAV